VVASGDLRDLADRMITDSAVRQRQACQTVRLAHSTHQYRRKVKDDGALIEALTELVSKRPAVGFDRCFLHLCNTGHAWNHKRVNRVYKQLGLNIRRRMKRRLPARIKMVDGLHARLPLGWAPISAFEHHR
jgi:putative transposase